MAVAPFPQTPAAVPVNERAARLEGDAKRAARGAVDSYRSVLDRAVASGVSTADLAALPPIVREQISRLNATIRSVALAIDTHMERQP